MVRQARPYSRVGIGSAIPRARSRLLIMYMGSNTLSHLLTLKRKNDLPIIFHTDYGPTVLECEQEVTEETEKQFSAISVSFL